MEVGLNSAAKLQLEGETDFLKKRKKKSHYNKNVLDVKRMSARVMHGTRN